MVLGPIEFAQPVWLLLIPALAAVSWFTARRSLTGLGRAAHLTALGVRFLVLTLLAAALADPHSRRVSEGVAVTAIVDASRSVPPEARAALKPFLVKAAEAAQPDDRLGFVSAADRALAQALPGDNLPPATRAGELRAEEWDAGSRAATDLAAGVRLAMAVTPEDKAGRLLLFSDGNETAGSLLTAAKTARSAGIPIDVLPVPYALSREVVFDKLIAPASARKGQSANLRVVLTATAASRGKILLAANGETLDLAPGEPGEGFSVALEPGQNVITVPVPLDRSGPQQFEAVFEPDDAGADAIVENNRSVAVTFVSGEGRVLIVTNDPGEAAALARALDESRIDAEVWPPSQLPGSLVGLQAYDAILLADVAAADLPLVQQQELTAYVHDAGGGLAMIGGPNAFGAGGWQGSPVADALPVKLDPPQKRQIPKGALVCVMHSCEVPQGNYWGQQTAQAAADALSRLDLIGVLEYSWGGLNADGTTWAFPLSPKGDGAGVARAIKNLAFGDMPDFQSIMQQAYNALKAAPAGQKHCIVISDGDPAAPSAALMTQFFKAQITISTVEVFPHGGGFGNTMKWMAASTGGKYYSVNSQGQLATLPQIFTKEAQIVKRSLIWEGNPVEPKIINVGAEALRGIGPGLPSITGYVVTAERDGLALTTIKGPNDDPICAQWQYGLGRVFAFTSDAATRWSAAWVGWAQYRAFWEQHVRWAMRPTGSSNLTLTTEDLGGRTRVVVSALDAAGEPLNFATFDGRVSGPGLKALSVPLRQTGPGRYEGEFDSAQPGAYLASFIYRTPRPGGGADSGSVQAAVTRPFADEFRALKDNTPLLRQVAELTGGRVLDIRSPAAADLFSRAGLTMPVSRRPVWLPLTLAAIGLFLADVGVRRVRIDLRAIAAWLRRAFSPAARAQQRSQVEALRAARSRAEQRVAPARGAGADAAAGVKFEAGAEHTAGKPPSPIVSPAAGDRDRPSPPAPAAESQPAEDAGGLSRLRQAKQRAKQRMGDDESKPPP